MRWFSRTLYTHFFHLGVVLCQLFDTLNGKYQKSKKIATDPNYLRCHGFTTVLDFPMETTCSCKQDTKERYWGQPWILANGKAHFGSTDRNNQTDHCGPPSKLVPNVPVGPNRNGPFHSDEPTKFPEFWVEWKAPEKTQHAIIYRFSQG